MSTVGQPERATQNRVVGLFRDELGYRYLGDWTDRDSNSNIEEGRLSTWLTGRGYSAAQIGVALHKLRTEAAKDIKNVYLSVHPPTGRVRISAPKRMRLDTIRVFAISKLAWIRQQQTNCATRSVKPLGNTWSGKATTSGASGTC